MKKNVLIITLAVVSLLRAGDIFPQPADSGMGMGPGRGPMMRRGMGPNCYGNLEKMKETLQLSDTQIKEISRINGEFRDTMTRLNDRLKPLQKKLKNLLLEDGKNEAELRSLLKKISDIEVDIRMARIQHRFAIERVLTKEQRKKLGSERSRMMHDGR